MNNEELAKRIADRMITGFQGSYDGDGQATGDVLFDNSVLGVVRDDVIAAVAAELSTQESSEPLVCGACEQEYTVGDGHFPCLQYRGEESSKPTEPEPAEWIDKAAKEIDAAYGEHQYVTGIREVKAIIQRCYEERSK